MNPTYFPDRNWIVQQFKNISIDEVSFPEHIIIDNDGIYGKWVDPLFYNFFKIKTLRTSPGKPWQNGHIERNHRSLKEELLNRTLMVNIDQVRSLCNKYKKYFNENRPHQGISGNTPDNLRSIKSDKLSDLSKIEKTYHLDGFVTEFKLAN